MNAIEFAFMVEDEENAEWEAAWSAAFVARWGNLADEPIYMMVM